ncbi:MAG: 5'/3'-nucleotidase SurE [Candidatus Edwardsbacteria bacterium]
MKRPKFLILLTNDDGIKAEGLKVLHRELLPLGEVFVFAPKDEKSGASHSFSLRQPLEVVWLDRRTASVDGTPTDCVMLAVRGLLKRKPDLVVSGLNQGPNLGDDVTYSGTVAGAIEGTLLGIPSISVSVTSWNHCRFDLAAKFTAQLVRLIKKNGLPKNTLLNVNVPNLPKKKIKGVKITRLGKRIYRDVIIEKAGEEGKKLYIIDGEDPGWEKEENTDFAAIENNSISITPFHLDLTNYGAIKILKVWEKELNHEF